MLKKISILTALLSSVYTQDDECISDFTSQAIEEKVKADSKFLVA